MRVRVGVTRTQSVEWVFETPMEGKRRRRKSKKENLSLEYLQTVGTWGGALSNKYA